MAAQLRRTVRSKRIDLVHSYEGYLSVEAYFGARLLSDVPVIASVMAMWVGRLPQSLPVIVGTRTLEADARRWRAGNGWRLEPPVDVAEDHPGVETEAFRREFDLSGDVRTLVMVTRLDRDLKLEGVLRAVNAVDALAARLPVRLVVAGGGYRYDELVRRAEDINAVRGRQVIVVTGPLVDPRPAYAAADVVLGMGSSILRGMAFAKPAVVVALLGFSGDGLARNPRQVSARRLHRRRRRHHPSRGAHRPPRGVAVRVVRCRRGQPRDRRLADQIERLLADEDRRERLGRFGRELVTERYAPTGAAQTLEGLYRQVLDAGVRRTALVPEGLTTLAWASVGALKGRALKVLPRIQATRA